MWSTPLQLIAFLKMHERVIAREEKRASEESKREKGDGGGMKEERVADEEGEDERVRGIERGEN